MIPNINPLGDNYIHSNGSYQKMECCSIPIISVYEDHNELYNMATTY